MISTTTKAHFSRNSGEITIHFVREVLKIWLHKFQCVIY